MRKILMNLNSATERLETFYRVNKHIEGVERFSAIEGKGLRSSLKESGLLLSGEADERYTNGALGCALSHAEQWRRAVSSGEALTVIEDDAVFCKNFEEEHKRLLKTLPETWDFILWGYNLDVPLSYQVFPGSAYNVTLFEKTALQQNIDLWSNTCISGRVFKLFRTFGLFCYSVSPHGAKKLLEFCFPIRAMRVNVPGYIDLQPNGGIDIAMSALYPEIESYVCMPPLVVAPENKETSQTLHN
ncbi:MAG: glycosyltransferase family 25 protein [Acetobacter sp.]|nr:glycosyltransferase family 25 protein [Acetobacter sp.]